MKAHGLISCVLYMLAGVALSATQLCVDPQGNAVYELSDSGCCGDEPRVDADESGADLDGHMILAAPKCGGCTITKVLLPCAPVVQMFSAIPDSGETPGAAAGDFATVCSVVAPSTAFTVPRMSLPLRC